MNRFQKLMQNAARKLDLPQDIAADLPFIQLRGFGECCMDQHRGILAYEPEEIVVRLNIGTLTIKGSGLEVCRMRRDGLCIQGTIRSLTLEEE